MSDCAFTTTPLDDGRFQHVCHGGTFVKRGHRYVRRCDCERVKPGNCRHLGDTVRLELCPTCGGKVQIKIFACALHGECSLEAALAQIKVCNSCPDAAPR